MLFRCLLLAGAAAPLLALAQDSPAPAVLDPLVVTATGHEAPASETLAALIVINRDEIQRSLATDVAELLRFHAGLELGRNGGAGQTTAIFIRGGESNHTLVLVDGVRVNPATSGGAALQNIAPNMIERIEIVKGPRSTLYGSDAIGGVINIVTRAPAGRAAEGLLRGGSHGTRDASAFVAGGTGDHGVSLYAQAQTLDGTPSCAGSSAARGHDQTTLNLRSYARLGDARLSAQAWNAQGTAEYLDFCDAALGNNPRDQDYLNRAIAAEAAWDWREGFESRARLSMNLDEIRQNQSTDFVRTRRPAVGWTQALAAGPQRLTVGIEAAQEQVDALTFGTAVEENRDLHGAHAQYEFGAGAHRALLALSAWHYDAFGSPVTWNAEYGYDVTAATRLIAAAGSGFRAPDATDRFGFGGNPDLRPERARTYELGVRRALGVAHVAELRAFRNDVRDLVSIECVANCGAPDFLDDVFLAQNVDETRNDGLELSYRFERPAFGLRLAALKQDPRAESRPDPCSGEARLCRRATESVSASAVGRFGAAFVALDALGVGERVDFGGTPLPGYGLVGLGAGLELAQRWRLAARVENVLDKDYQTAAGYRQPGLGFFVTVGARL